MVPSFKNEYYSIEENIIVFPLTHWVSFMYFQYLTIINEDAMHFHMQVFLWTWFFETMQSVSVNMQKYYFWMVREHCYNFTLVSCNSCASWLWFATYFFSFFLFQQWIFFFFSFPFFFETGSSYAALSSCVSCLWVLGLHWSTWPWGFLFNQQGWVDFLLSWGGQVEDKGKSRETGWLPCGNFWEGAGTKHNQAANQSCHSEQQYQQQGRDNSP